MNQPFLPGQWVPNRTAIKRAPSGRVLLAALRRALLAPACRLLLLGLRP